MLDVRRMAVHDTFAQPFGHGLVAERDLAPAGPTSPSLTAATKSANEWIDPHRTRKRLTPSSSLRLSNTLRSAASLHPGRGSSAASHCSTPCWYNPGT
jgi:hypothetical protein